MDPNHILNPYSEFPSCMLKGFKDITTSILHSSSVLVQCFTSLAKAVTSQTENREPFQRVIIEIMPEYLLETNGFRIK